MFTITIDVHKIIQSFLVVMLVTTLCACSSRRIISPKTRDNGTYYAAVQQLKQRKTDIDYTAMRYDFVKTKDYQKSLRPAYQERKKDIYQEIEKRDFVRCVQKSDRLLDENYTDLKLHFVTFFCASMLKDKPKYETHMKIIEGLLASIREDVSLKKPAQYITVIDENELSGFVSVVYGGRLDDTTILKNENTYSALIWEPWYLRYQKQYPARQGRYIYFRYLTQNE